jgi:hypothetical protein
MKKNMPLPAQAQASFFYRVSCIFFPLVNRELAVFQLFDKELSGSRQHGMKPPRDSIGVVPTSRGRGVRGIAFKKTIVMVESENPSDGAEANGKDQFRGESRDVHGYC